MTIINRHLHEKILSHLLSKRDILKTNTKDFFFRLRRTNRYNKLEQGFWFHGTENYLALSFWSGSDWKNKTPNIYFAFNKNGDVYLEFSAKDSKEKVDVIKSLLYEGFKNSKKELVDIYAIKKDDDFFQLKLNYRWNEDNITYIIDKILSNEKKHLDKKLFHLLAFEGDKLSNRIHFIFKKDFETLLSNVNKHRERLNLKSSAIDSIPLAGTTINYITTQSNLIYENERMQIRDEKLKILLDELPIALQELNIINYKSLSDIFIKKIPSNKQWIFLIGENGLGKTSLLEAIAIAMNGNIDGNVILNSDNFEIKAKFYYPEKNKSQKVKWHNGKDNSKNELINELACYGPNRFDISSTPTITKIDHSRKTYNLFHNDGNLLSIEDAMIKWNLKGRLFLEEELIKSKVQSEIPKIYEKYEKYTTLYNNVKDILLGSEDNRTQYDETNLDLKPSINKGFLPDITDMEPNEKLDDDKLYYYYDNSKDNPLTFSKLSTGNKSLLAMVGDIILRFLEYNKDKPYPDPSDFEGIVLIDELDAHIHPEWQYQLPSLLSEAFPKIQFIATCHSPIPLLGVKEGEERASYFKISKNESSKIIIEEFKLETSELTPNTILSSPLFDFRRFLSAGFKTEKGYTSKDDYEEFIFNKILKKKFNELDQLEANEENK